MSRRKPKAEHEDHAYIAREVHKNNEEIEKKGGLMLNSTPQVVQKPWLKERRKKPPKKCSVCLGLTGYKIHCPHCKGTGEEPKENNKCL